MKKNINRYIFSRRQWIALGVLCTFLSVWGIPVNAFAHVQKEEVVYANLSGDGAVEQIYVVNSFVLDEEGKIVDYGDYTALRNMTSMEELQFENQCVTVDAKAGRLYYEGILNNTNLPWQFTITYWLDGKALSAEELAGKDGHLQIDLKITQNPHCNTVFFDNYALQVTVQLDTAICRNIRAEDATIASVGRNKQITYTLLPGQDSLLSISADVTDFVMEQISFNGITLSMAVELNETHYGEVANGLKQISKVAAQFDDGVLGLFYGMESLYDGAKELADGLYELKNGIVATEDGSNSLSDGISELKEGAQALYSGSEEAVNGVKEVQNGAESLQEAAKTLHDGTHEIYFGMQELHGGIVEVNTYLKKLDAEIAYLEQELQKTEEQQAWLDEIVNKVTSVMIEYEFYDEVLQQMEQLEQSIERLKVFRETISDFYDAMMQLESGSAQLLQAVEELYDGTGELHEGTVLLQDGSAALYDGMIVLQDGTSELVDGIVQLEDGSIALAQGVVQLRDGCAELCNGAITLEDGILQVEDGLITLQGGTMEFRNETADLDRKLIKELRDGMDALFGTGDKPISFVSEQNANVSAVQFVIRTPSITVLEPSEPLEESPEHISFWQKLLRLFGIVPR